MVGLPPGCNWEKADDGYIGPDQRGLGTEHSSPSHFEPRSHFETRMQQAGHSYCFFVTADCHVVKLPYIRLALVMCLVSHGVPQEA